MCVCLRGGREREQRVKMGMERKSAKKQNEKKPRAGRWRQTAGDARYGSGMEGESGDKISELL